jgi:WD40 repeat protein
LGGVHSVAFSPDSARLAVGSDGSEGIKLWDTQSLMEVLELRSQGGALFRSAFSPDGNLLGAMNKIGLLQVWRAPSWGEIEAAETAR